MVPFLGHPVLSDFHDSVIQGITGTQQLYYVYSSNTAIKDQGVAKNLFWGV